MSRIEDELAEKLRMLRGDDMPQLPKYRKRELLYIGSFLALLILHLATPNAGPQAPSLPPSDVAPPAASPAAPLLDSPLPWAATVEQGGRVRYYVRGER